VAPITDAADDLADSVRRVTAAASRSLTETVDRGAARARAARPPYPYRYGSRVAAAAKATRPRSSTGDKLTASVRIGGRGQVFSGGASVSDLVWGAEFGARSGDVVRVKTTGGSRTVNATSFRDYASRVSRQYTIVTYGKNGKARRRTVTATTAGARQSQVTGVRKGGLGQFPARQKQGWFLTPAIEDAETASASDTLTAFARALDGSG
jgi:hypothetical protein